MNHSNHAFRELDQSLQELEGLLTATITTILQMNDKCVAALEALHDKGFVQTTLREARKMDKQINQLEFEIVAAIQRILGKYNPRGRDLRFIIGSIKLSTLLESIADKSKNCIKRMYKIEALPSPVVMEKLRLMLAENHAITVLVHQLLLEFDRTTADEINKKRKQIELLYRDVWLQKTNVDADYHNIVMLAKNIERIADMVIDLKKIIYFVQTGEKLTKRKKDTSATIATATTAAGEEVSA
jgi:phosphate transport system protein